jgi:muramoyltetrapeptide carboxypeptidase
VTAATRFGRPLPAGGTIGVAAAATRTYLDGQLVQLAHAGELEQVAGVVVGQMEKSDYGDVRPVSDWARSRTVEDILEEPLGSLGVPVINGHAKHLAAVPLGVACTLDADAKTLTVDGPGLR